MRYVLRAKNNLRLPLHNRIRERRGAQDVRIRNERVHRRGRRMANFQHDIFRACILNTESVLADEVVAVVERYAVHTTEDDACVRGIPRLHDSGPLLRHRRDDVVVRGLAVEPRFWLRRG